MSWRDRLAKGLSPSAETSEPGDLKNAMGLYLAGRLQPFKLYKQLNGPQREWWKYCLGTARGTADELSAEELSEVFAVISRQEPPQSPGAVTDAAQAVYAVSRGLAADEDADQRYFLNEAASRWRNGPATPTLAAAASFSVDAAVAQVPLGLQDRTRSVLGLLGNVLHDRGEAMVAICALMLTGSTPNPRNSVRVSVVLAVREQGRVDGVTGNLEVQVLPGGPAGLYPDPRAMTIQPTDEAFDRALRLAWQFAGGDSQPSCVLWRVTPDADVPGHGIDGSSLGTPFAISLQQLLKHRPASRLLSFATLRGFLTRLRPGCVITGELSGHRPSGYAHRTLRRGPWLASVGHMDAKVKATGARHMRLVAPVGNKPASPGDIPAGVHVYWAGTLRQADRYARRIRPVRTAATSLAVLAVIGGSVGPAVAVHYDTAARQQQAAAASAHDLEVSNALAAQSEATGDADPVMARLEAVAAWRVRHTATATYAMLTAALLPWAAVLPSSDGTQVSAVAFSPRGELMATGTSGGTIQLCDLARKAACQRLPGTIKRVESVAFSSDGKLLAVGSADGPIQLFDVTSRKPAFTLPVGTNNAVYPVAFSPDGKLLAVGTLGADGSGSTQLWNIASRTLTTTLPAVAAAHSVNAVNSVAFSSNSKLLAVGTGDGAVQLWDLTSPKPKVTAPVITGSDANSVALSADGKFLAVGTSNGKVQLWDLASRTLQATLPADSTYAVYSVAFSPDSKLLAVDTGSGTTQLWDLASRTLRATLPAGSLDTVTSVAFSADSKFLATGTLTGTRLSDIAADLAISSPVATLPVGKPGSIMSVALSDDGTLLAAGTGTGTVQLWDVTTRTLQATLPAGGNSWVLSVAFSPDGKLLAASTGTGTVRLWDVTTRTLQATLPAGANSLVFSVAFSRGGKFLAASTGTGTVRLWNVTTRRPTVTATLPTGTSHAIGSVAFSPDGKFLAVGTSIGTVQLWDIASRKPTVAATLPIGITNEVWSAAFSPDGKLLAAETDNGTVRLWDVATRNQVTATPILAKALISTVAFSADATTLAIGSGEGVQLWDASTSQQIGVLPVNSSDYLLHGAFMAVSSQSALLAVATGAGDIQLWSTPYLIDTVPYLCALAGQSFPPGQWAKDAPGLPYTAACPG